MLDLILEILRQSWFVLGEMGPYLLLGFLVAGLLSVFVSPEWLERHLGGPGMGPVWKAAVLGVPLPLCSCGVIPVGASLRRHGASRPAVAAFMLSTPQTGVDSIAVTYAVLGPLFAIYRPVAALVTGVVGGALVRVLGERERPAGRPRRAAGPALPMAGAAACEDGCGGECGLPEPTAGGRLGRALRYGLVTLPRDIGTALLVGVLIAGTLSALVPAGSLHAYLGGGILSVLILMAAGVPIYVCATASVPIAAGLIHLGASPGAALAFLIAGPATNAATVTTLWHVLGRRTALTYLGTVAAAALGFGLLLDALSPSAAGLLPGVAEHVHGLGGASWYGHLFGALLLAVLAFSILQGRLARRRAAVRPGAGGRAAADAPGGGGTAPGPGAEQVLELRVEGMTCSHCAGSVERALSETAGVRRAEVDLAAGLAVVRGRNLDPARLVAAVESLGYHAEPRPAASA